MANQGHIEAYLSFDGNTRDALNFYKDVFHGAITGVMEWKDIPPDESADPSDIPDMPDDAIMNSAIRIGDTTVMMSDNPFMNTAFGDSVTLNWSHSDVAEVKRVWQAFVDAGAEVIMPIEETFFAPLFGQLKDQFGVHWQIMVWEPETQEQT